MLSCCRELHRAAGHGPTDWGRRALKDGRDLHWTGEDEAVGGIPILGCESCLGEGRLGLRYEEGAARRLGSSPGSFRGDAGPGRR